MPVLGSAGTPGLARGVVVPAGSLDKFRTALKNHASGLCEIVLWGDSTDDGANDWEGTTALYPWAMRLLDNMRAAGITYGGRGLFSYRMSIGATSAYTVDPDGYPLVFARDASGWTDSALSVNGFTSPSTAVGTTITFKGTGTSVRVNLQRGFNSSAKIGVTIDGGTETVYDTGVQAPAPTFYDVLPQATTGLTEGVHTVVFRNAGGADIKTPASAQTTISTSAGSGPTTGTWWYGITGVSANGESTMSTPISVAVNGSLVPQINYYAQTGWTSTKLYRSATQNGTYGLVNTISSPTVPSSMTATKNNISDTTGTGAAGAAPPGSSALGQLAGQSASAGIEFFRVAGVVIHNEGIYGKSYADFIDHTATNAAGWRGYAPARLGLQSETQAYSSNRNIGFINGLPQGTFPQYRKPALLIIKLGTNDINSYSPDATGTAGNTWVNFFENLAYAIRTARAAGADVLVISPPFTTSADPGTNHYSGRFKAAILSLVLSHGAAYADFQEALGWDMTNHISRGYQGGSAGIANPHLKIAGYQAEADWLWTNLIQPLLL